MRPDRLVAAALLAGGAVLALAPPAPAATPTGAWTDPAPHTTYEDTPVAYLDTPRPLAGFAQFEGGIAGVSFNLVDTPDPNDPCSATEEVVAQAAPGGANRVEFAFDAPFPCNRRYQVRARVEPQQRPLQSDSALVLNLWVDVALPPAPTSGVVAEVTGTDVVVRWNSAAQAPDFEGFQIQRAAGAGGYEPVGEAGAHELSFIDASVPEEGGLYRYRVLGMRPGPEEGTTVFSESGGEATVEVPRSPDAPVSDGDGSVAGPGGGGGTGSGSGGSSAPVRRTFRTPSQVRRSTTPTTADTGFQETLPFGPASPPSGDPAVVARVDGDDEEGQRQTLLLVAGGTTAFSWAMLLRFLSRRAMVL